MEPEYEQLLQWEEPGPAGSGEAPEPDKPWGDGIVVYGPSQLLRGKQVPSLMADSYSFKSQEELLRMQKYCHEQAAGSWSRLVADQSNWSLVIIFHVIRVVACIVACIVTCTDWSSHAF